MTVRRRRGAAAPPAEANSDSSALHHAGVATTVDKKILSERDICTKFVTPAVVASGWDVQNQIEDPHPAAHGRARQIRF